MDKTDGGLIKLTISVSLQGVDSGQGPTPFVGFTIWAELDEEPRDDGTDNATANQMQLGTFQAYDAQTKPHETCKPAVDNATAHPKTEIQVSMILLIGVCKLTFKIDPTHKFV